MIDSSDVLAVQVILNIGLTILGNWSFVKPSGFHETREIQQMSCEIRRHSLPTALHETKEFFVKLFDL